MTWTRLIHPESAANDYYISILNKNQEELESLKRERNRYVNLKHQEPENERYYDKLIELHDKRIADHFIFGYDGINNREEGYPILAQSQEVISEMFTRRYGRQRIAYSSYKEFQSQLQLTYDLTAPFYERAFTVYLKQEEIYNEEIQKNDPFSMRSTSDVINESENTSKETTLPDVEIEDPVYAGIGKQTGTNAGNSKSYDDSFTTRYAAVAFYESSRTNLYIRYLDEFAHLFQTIVW